MTWLALIGLWILASALTDVLIGRGIKGLRGGMPAANHHGSSHPGCSGNPVASGMALG